MKLLIVLAILGLSGCAGWTCNDGYQEDMFGDCTGHNGPDIQATFPSSGVDAVELMAVTAFNKFHNSTHINTSPIVTSGTQAFLNPPLKYREDDCDVHAAWVEQRLAAQGIGGDMIIAQAEFVPHAAFLTEDGRVIDINHREPLSLGEWLEFVSRI